MPGTSVDTHCPYCSLQCGMTLVATRGERALEVEARPDFPVNEGALCRKGWTATGLRGHRERLTTPLVRDRATGELSAVGWDEALDLVADRIATIRAESGDDAVAVFGGGGLTNEKAYLLGKFARVALGTSQIDYNGRWCMSSAASAANQAFGLDRGLPFPLADVEQADVVVLVGSNLAETMPPAARHLDRLRERGGRLVVVDPRATPTGERADVLLQPVPGTDLPVALGLLHLLDAAGALDEDYLAARTTGFDEVRRSVAGWWPERVERVSGVAAAELRAVADLLAGADRVMVLTARGAEQHSQGTATVLAWINLALALGMCGTPYAGYGCLTGQGNGQGGREHGQKSDQLPGYRMIDDAAAREHVAAVWGVEAASLPGPGRSAYELLDALGTDGGPRALLVHGSNIAVSAPDASRVTGRLAALDLLVVADIVLSETAAMADVVLPVTQWAEESGTMTNLEGRVVLREQAVAPPEGVRSDLDVLAGLAERLGCTADFPLEPEAAFAELARASAGGRADYAGITYDRIRAEQGVFWPCPEVDHPGTPRLFTDTFPTPDGRARCLVVDHVGAAEQPDDDYPVHLTTGRVLAQYQSGAQTRRVAALADDGVFVELHPLLAGRIGVADGDDVALRTRRGELRAPARVVTTIRPDTVFVPFHWVGANRLTHAALDPMSRMPEFKVCAVAVERAPSGRRSGVSDSFDRTDVAVFRPSEPASSVRSNGTGTVAGRCHVTGRIVVVGSGMAAHRLVESLVARGVGDVTLLGGERHAPYNRILLSAVLEGSHAVDAITLRTPRWYAEHGVDLRLGARVDRIDPGAATVVLVGGETVPYGTLVLATGSLPTLPPIRGLVRLDGRLHERLHSFRHLDDCLRLSADVAARLDRAEATGRDVRAVVVGGGLLGLQVARALGIRGVRTEIVEGGEHLLRSHVSAAAGRVLAGALRRLDTPAYTGARAVSFVDPADPEDPSQRCGLRLDNGHTLETDLVVITAGVRPSVSLARRAGLEVRRGVVVDDTLTTSDPAVHAIGDCAEHDGRTTGFVAPAWEQAELLAARLADSPGGPGSDSDPRYDGSRVVARLRATDLDVAVLGEPGRASAEGGEVVEVSNPIAGTHRRLVVREGRIVAATLVGDLSRIGLITQLFDRRTVLGPHEPGELLLGDAPVRPSVLTDEAEVCACAGVTAGRIRACASLEDVRETTRATTGCGGCAATVRQLLAQRASLGPIPGTPGSTLEGTPR